MLLSGQRYINFMQEEILKQFIGGIVRQLVTAIGVLLVSKKILPQSVVDLILTDQYILWIAGGVLVVVGFAWQYLKVKFNVNFANAAHQASVTTPMSEVKKIAKRKETTQVSV